MPFEPGDSGSVIYTRVRHDERDKIYLKIIGRFVGGIKIGGNGDDAEYIYLAICLDAALRNLEQEYGDSITNLQLEPKLTLRALINYI